MSAPLSQVTSATDHIDIYEVGLACQKENVTDLPPCKLNDWEWKAALTRRTPRSLRLNFDYRSRITNYRDSSLRRRMTLERGMRWAM